MPAIPIEAVHFEPFSYRDPNGRLFQWNGGLYRTIRGKAAAFHRGLFDKGIIQRLVDEGF